MAINETSVDGKKYRQKTADGWKWYSFITKAKDILFGNGDNPDNNLETNLGSFKGITTSTSVTETGYAADATVVSSLNESLTTLTFNNQTLIGFTPYGSTVIAVQFPFFKDEANVKTSVATYFNTSSGWKNITYHSHYVEGNMLFVNYQTGDTLTQGSCYLVKLTGTIS